MTSGRRNAYDSRSGTISLEPAAEGLSPGMDEIWARMLLSGRPLPTPPTPTFGVAPPPPVHDAAGVTQPAPAQVAAAAPDAVQSDTPGGLHLAIMAGLEAKFGGLEQAIKALGETSRPPSKAELYRHCHPIKIPAGQITAGGTIADQQKYAPRTGYAWHVTRLSIQGNAGATHVDVYRDAVNTDSTGNSAQWLNGGGQGNLGAAAGLQSVQASSPAAGVSAPGAGTAIASISAAALAAVAPVGTTWQVQWTTQLLSGAPTATDANNMDLDSPAGTLREKGMFLGALGTYPQQALTYTPAGTGFTVVNALAATAGVVYGAQITATPLLAGTGLAALMWEPKLLILLPNDQLVFGSTAGGMTVNGEAIEIELPWLADYLL